MAWYSRLLALFGERKAMTPYDLSLELLRESAAKSGIRVTAEIALQASTALACTRVIAEGLAQVPLKLYRTLPNGGSEPATDHPLYQVISTAPNPDLTSFEWRECAGMHLALGNRSYAIIARGGNARAQTTELWPVAPERVRTERNGVTTRYFVQMGDGTHESEVPAERMLHLRGPSWNGWEGIDGVRLAREAIGLSLGLEEHGARLFRNGAIVGGILSTEQILNAEQRKQLRDSWHDSQAGIANVYKTAVLWGGMKYQPRALQNDQAQWVEVRRFQVEEVCRFYRIQPIMVGADTKTAAYASSEQMFLAHVVHTMAPWYKRIEQRLDLALLTPEERAAGYFHRFSMQALMRGAHRDRAAFYQTLHGIGALSANEIRNLEEMNPYEGGDDYFVASNSAPVGDEDPNADAAGD